MMVRSHINPPLSYVSIPWCSLGDGVSRLRRREDLQFWSKFMKYAENWQNVFRFDLKLAREEQVFESKRKSAMVGTNVPHRSTRWPARTLRGAITPRSVLAGRSRCSSQSAAPAGPVLECGPRRTGPTQISRFCSHATHVWGLSPDHGTPTSARSKTHHNPTLIQACTTVAPFIPSHPSLNSHTTSLFLRPHQLTLHFQARHTLRDDLTHPATVT